MFHLIFDFDLTLTRIHTGGIYRKLAREELIAPDLALRLKQQALDDGHKVSICTHGESRDMISETLELIGLKPPHLQAIKIITGMADDKNDHIVRAYREQGLLDENGRLTSRHPVRTILFEDNEHNAKAAAYKGAIVLLARHEDFEDRLIIDQSHLEVGQRILQSPHQAERIAQEHAFSRGYSGSIPRSK